VIATRAASGAAAATGAFGMGITYFQQQRCGISGHRHYTELGQGLAPIHIDIIFPYFFFVCIIQILHRFSPFRFFESN
jgi:hypothetical protein